MDLLCHLDTCVRDGVFDALNIQAHVAVMPSRMSTA